MNEEKAALPEPWLRGTLAEVPAVPRAVLHALELGREDLWKWCFGLSDGQLNARPAGIASVAFPIRHIARSLDRSVIMRLPSFLLVCIGVQII